MRDTPSQDPARHLDSTTRHSLGYVFVISALGAVGIVALVMALLYPVTAAGVALLGGAGFVATRQLRRLHRMRQRTGKARTVCSSKLGVCVTV